MIYVNIGRAWSLMSCLMNARSALIEAGSRRPPTLWGAKLDTLNSTHQADKTFVFSVRPPYPRDSRGQAVAISDPRPEVSRRFEFKLIILIHWWDFDLSTHPLPLSPSDPKSSALQLLCSPVQGASQLLSLLCLRSSSGLASS